MIRGDRENVCSAFKMAKNGHKREGGPDLPKPNITFGPPAPTLPAASPHLFPFNLYQNLFNGSAGLLGSSLAGGVFNPMLALAAQHSPLLASAYANMAGNGISPLLAGGGLAAHPSDRFRQQRFSPYETGREVLTNGGSAFDAVMPRIGGGGVSPPSHRPPLSPASVCSSTSSFHANNSSSNDLLSIEKMVKGIDKSQIRVKNNLSEDQMSEKVLLRSPCSDSRWKIRTNYRIRTQFRFLW